MIRLKQEIESVNRAFDEKEAQLKQARNLTIDSIWAAHIKRGTLKQDLL